LRTQAGLVAARARGRHGVRKPKMTPALVDKAQRMYNSHRFTMAEIAHSCAVSPMTIYRHISTGQPDARAVSTSRLALTAVRIDPLPPIASDANSRRYAHRRG